MSFDPATHKLGKLAPKFVPGIPRLTSILTDVAPATPSAIDWTAGKKSFGVMGNDTLGDCTAAAVGHLYQIWTMNAYMDEWSPTAAQVIEFYSASTGYDPKDQSTDRGGVETDVLDCLQKNGFCDRHIVGHASVDMHSLGAVKQAIFMAGGAYIGAELPKRIQSQGNVWRVPALSWLDPQSKPGSLGGHAIAVVGFDDADGLFKMISWGEIYYMSYEWFLKYVDECWVIVAGAWIRNAKSPRGIDETALVNFMLKKEGRK